MQKVYLYTITYKTGKINERIGYLQDRHGVCGGFIFQEEGTRRYLTNAPLMEGVFRGASVWFLEPNLEGAKKVFEKKAYEMQKTYLDKFLLAEERSLPWNKE